MLIGMRSLKRTVLIFLLGVTFVSVISSCRTSRDVSVARLKPLSANKLLENARENAFDFDNLSIRRINVQFSNEDSRTSFRASIKAMRDENILASISKLNIPVGRVLLSPDSVTYVNYIEKNYFQGDYHFLGNMLNFDLNFNIVQSLISNPLNSGLTKSTLTAKSFKSFIEDGKYVLQSEQDPSRQYAGSKGFIFRNNRRNNNHEEQAFAGQKLYFNPQNFVLEKMILNDPNRERNLEVRFSDFQKVDDYDYPGAIDITFISQDDMTELNLKLRGFSTEKVETLNITIPERYQSIRTR